MFNLASKRAENTMDEDYVMRRNAIDFAIPLFNEPQTSILFARALKAKLAEKMKVLNSNDVIVPEEVRSWEEYVGFKPV